MCRLSFHRARVAGTAESAGGNGPEHEHRHGCTPRHRGRPRHSGGANVIETIKSALLTAYRHTAGHQPDARIDIDRKPAKSGDGARTDDDGNVVSEWDDTPEGFGRVAATTARQVMLQRFRDAENEKIYGEFAAREGDIVAGVIQQTRAPMPRRVVLRMGSETKFSEGTIPPAEQVPGESYDHGDRLRCYVLGVTRANRGKIRCRTHPNLVKLFSLEVPEIAEGSVEIVAVAREAGHRSKIAVASKVAGLNAKGACIGPMGQRVRNVMRELSDEKIDIIDYDEGPGAVRRQRAVAGQGHLGDRHRPAGAGGPRGGA